MGACLTLERDEIEARRRSEEIDKQLESLAKERPRILKILLLGAGESGKSTLVKQMKIIHSDGFTQSELSAFRPTVLDNLLSSMKYVLTGMGLLRINLEHASNKIYAEIVRASPSCFDAGFVCDFCAAEPIIGTRWHCETCKDDSIDFCSDCLIAQFTSDEMHPLSHKRNGLRVRQLVQTAGPQAGSVFDEDSEMEANVYDKVYMLSKFAKPAQYNYLDPTSYLIDDLAVTYPSTVNRCGIPRRSVCKFTDSYGGYGLLLEIKACRRHNTIITMLTKNDSRSLKLHMNL